MSRIPATGLATDARSLALLKSDAARDPGAVVKQAAQQFEALFMQQLMKGMRSSTMASGLLDNEGSKLGTELLDGQFATQMSGRPGGLSDLIARQLQRQIGTPAATADGASDGDGADGADGADGTGGATLPRLSAAPAAVDGRAPTVQRTPLRPPATAQEFVDRHQGAAKGAEAASGIPATFMLAQAAHETGWGKREIRMADGSNAHNLFGIKAGANWKGPVAEVSTTEYVGGRAQKVTAKFRAYSSYDDSFADYAKLMKESPRYASVVASAGSAKGFAQGLQRAGYATDPAYADKLSRVINTTLRLQRVAT